jgi:hypothetical protein
MYNQIDINNSGYNGCLGDALTSGTVNTPTREVRNRVLDVYICPSDDTEASTVSGFQGTNYAAAVRAAGNRNHSLVGQDNTTLDAGGITRSGTRIADFKDGTSNTILVGEVYRGKKFTRTSSGPVNVNRQRCRDWMESTAYCQVNSGARHDAGAATTDNPYGWVAIKSENGFQAIGSRVINDPEDDQVSWTDSVDSGNQGSRPMSSAHEGGVQALLGDGSVKFISENVDVVSLAHSFGRADGQVRQLEF